MIGKWAGGPRTYRVARDKLDKLAGDRLVVIVQSPGAGPIYGAALTAL